MNQPNGQDARRHERREAGFPCVLVVGAARHDSRALDISAGGMRLEMAIPPGVTKGQSVIIELGAYGAFDAEAVWLGEWSLGLRFEADPMEMVDVLEAIAVNGYR